MSAAELADELQHLQNEQASAAAQQLWQQDEARVLTTGLVMQLQVVCKPPSDPLAEAAHPTPSPSPRSLALLLATAHAHQAISWLQPSEVAAAVL